MSKHLLHKKSNELIDGKAKLPLVTDIVHGELAINYAKGQETLAIKNSNDEIITLPFGGSGGDSSDKVAKSGDTMTGQLNIEHNLNIGSGNTVSGLFAFAQGGDCTASGLYTHAEGYYTVASGSYSHAEGRFTTASGEYSHAEGYGTIANRGSSHAEGYYTKASGSYSHAEGTSTTASGYASHAEGISTEANGIGSHAEGDYTIVNNYAEHASGTYNKSISGTNQNLTALTADTQATLFSIGNGVPSYGDYERRNAFEVKYNGDTYITGNTSIAKTLNIGRSNTVSGNYSSAQGSGCTAIGLGSHAEGLYTDAIAQFAHAEGDSTKASGNYSHAEGYVTTANNNTSHAEGSRTTANGISSHAEGESTITNNRAEHASGTYNVSISGMNQTMSALTNDSQATLFSIGNGYDANRKNAIEVKYNGDTYISGDTKFAQGITASTISSPTIDAKQDLLVSGTNIKTINGEDILGSGDLVIVADSSDKVAKSGDTMSGTLNIQANLNIGSGNTFTSANTNSAGTIYNGRYSFIQGNRCVAIGNISHAEGYGTTATTDGSHAEGLQTTASGSYSHAEGYYTTASGNYGSHAEGYGSHAKGEGSHAEGGTVTGPTRSSPYGCLAEGDYSHAEGGGTKAIGKYSHAEGERTIAIGNYSHAEGFTTMAIGESSHAEGAYAEAIGTYSHAEGGTTKANGGCSHAEGGATIANGDNSHAEGIDTIANNTAEHASGVYNVSISGTNQDDMALANDSQATLFSIGNGYRDFSVSPSVETRKNAFEVKYNGDTYISGDTKFAKGITANTISANTISSPTIDAINDSLTDKQDTLVSGTNIKTINGESLLGSGDLLVNIASSLASNLVTKQDLEDFKIEIKAYIDSKII